MRLRWALQPQLSSNGTKPATSYGLCSCGPGDDSSLINNKNDDRFFRGCRNACGMYNQETAKTLAREI